ncbi:MAG: hypothetical protein ACYS0C_01460 [Planctomycetota bacterium]|jgi:hypothetical protein
MKKAKGFMIAVGVISTVLAVLGLWYNSSSLFTDFSEFVQEQDIPYFYPAFYTMSAVCIACYSILLICGVQFLRLRTRLLSLFVVVLIFEVIYFFSIGAMWLVPKIGMSVAAATGVANGGLTFQAFVLFPLWAPFLTRWAARKISKSGEPSNQGIQPTS